MANDVGSDYSAEFKTFKEYIPCLEKTLKNNLTPILEELNERGLINYDAHDKVKEFPSLLTPAQKAELIVRSLKDVIGHCSDRFYELIEVLSDKRVANYYKDVVVKLIKPFGRLLHSTAQKHRQLNCTHGRLKLV